MKVKANIELSLGSSLELDEKQTEMLAHLSSYGALGSIIYKHVTSKFPASMWDQFFADMRTPLNCVVGKFRAAKNIQVETE